MSTSLLTTQAAEAYLAKDQFVLERQTLKKEKFLIYRTGTPKIMVSKREEQNLETK
jgi:hypothetical protein